ncbi:MAG TPA: MBL fold metallo-hydrolase [Syntrophorhabdaceae bacterium]|nr:MBL fold metallo-hydrolase [Syntrophorhabdaceae bacterium]
MKPVEVIKDVYMIGDSGMTDSKDCSVYLIDVGELILIDTGAGDSVDKIVKNISVFGLNPERLSTIILTHCHIDHVGGAEELRKRFNARIIMHEKDADVVERGDKRMTAAYWYGVDFKPLSVDIKIKTREEKLIFGDHEVICIHTPGHTPGSISVYTDINDKRVLFGQDIHGPFLPDFGANMSDWKRSMEALLALQADILCEGHFGIFRSKEAVNDYIERYLEEYG